MKNRILTLIANEVRGLFDASAEPTLEVLTGKDSFNQAIAAGAQAADLLDGDRDGRLTVNTNGVATVFHLDAALDRRLRVDRVVLDGHTLRKAYGDDVGNLVKVLYNSTDNYGTATEAAIARVQSRLLARGAAHLAFDGIDDYVMSAHNAIFDWSNINGIEVIFRIPATASTYQICGCCATYANTAKGWTLCDPLGAGLVLRLMDDDQVGYEDVALSTTADDGELHHVFLVKEADGTVTPYYDGAAGTPSADISQYDCDNALVFSVGSRNGASNFLPTGSEIFLLRIWNSINSAADVLARFNGWTHTPIDVADQYGNDTNLISNGGLPSGTDHVDTTPNDGISDGWAQGVGVGTYTINAAHDGFDNKSQRVTCLESGFGGLRTPEQIVAGTRYRISFNYRATTALFYVRERITPFTTIIDPLDVNASGDIVHVEKEFTCVKSGYVEFLFNNESGAGEYFEYSDVSVVEVGCEVEWRPEGISPTHGKWHDRSSNNLHGTITGAEARDVPIGDEGEVLLIELDQEIDARYLYLKVNPGGLTGDANALFGQMLLDRAAALSGVRKFDEDLGYPGIDVMEAYGGSELPSVRYEGERREWPLHLVAQGDDFRDGIYRVYKAAKGAKKVPLYLVEDIALNDGRPERLIYCVKFDAPLRRKRTGKYHEIETALREVAG